LVSALATYFIRGRSGQAPDLPAGTWKNNPKKDRAQDDGKKSSSLTLQIQALESLKEVHQAGFIHQDVKPVSFSFSNFKGQFCTLARPEQGLPSWLRPCHEVSWWL